ncbi:MAG: glycosyltransferase family 2 protein [Chitinophagaceae bacterium]|nr:MAG: glycosyltransferase family 2 protein [Chitinophagaceae bacterium]
MTTITILMPVYNGMPYIIEAVESVLKQKYTDWDLIISDNCSTDNTCHYLDTLIDARIKIYKQETNLGIYGNINFLIKCTQSTIAKILCADDILLPDALERIVHFMVIRPNCVISRCLAENDKKKFMPLMSPGFEGTLPNRLKPTAALLAFATFGNLIGNLSKVAFRPQLIIEAGGFNQNLPFAGDYEGWARIAGLYGLDLQNEELIFERIHLAQNTNLLNMKNELYQQINILLEKFSTQVCDNDLAILKRHWTIHFLAPRLSRVIIQILAGEFNLAKIPLKDLPLGISKGAVIAAYPIWKLNLPIANSTTRQLFNRIIELNADQP